MDNYQYSLLVITHYSQSVFPQDLFIQPSLGIKVTHQNFTYCQFLECQWYFEASSIIPPELTHLYHLLVYNTGLYTSQYFRFRVINIAAIILQLIASHFTGVFFSAAFVCIRSPSSLYGLFTSMILKNSSILPVHRSLDFRLQDNQPFIVVSEDMHRIFSLEDERTYTFAT